MPAEWYNWHIWVPVHEKPEEVPDVKVEHDSEHARPAHDFPLPNEPGQNEAYGDELCGYVWDPVNGREVILVSMKDVQFGENGVWNVEYQDDSGTPYFLSNKPMKIECKHSETPPAKPVTTDDKIRFQPVTHTNFSKFAEKAWNGEKDPELSSESPAVPVSEKDEEHVSPAGSNGDKGGPDWETTGSKDLVASQLREALGDKPVDNDPSQVLGLDDLKGMTLAEHLKHVSWYKSSGDFKSKIPNDISNALWWDLVQLFVFYHAYDITDHETALWELKEFYARQFLVSICCTVVTQPKTCFNCPSCLVRFGFDTHVVFQDDDPSLQQVCCPFLIHTIPMVPS